MKVESSVGATIERLKNHPYVSPNVSVQVLSLPVRHLVIKNLFIDDIYAAACQKFDGVVGAGDPPHPDAEYKAKIVAPQPKDFIEDKSLEFFGSVYWRNFVATIFNIQSLNDYVCNVYHEHSPPSQDGWIHRDVQLVSVNENPDQISSEGIRLCGIKGLNDFYTSDSKDVPSGHHLVARSVAGIYYLNNPGDAENLPGGGTALFDGPDPVDLVKEVKPVNNTMLIFEIGADSYHTYVGTPSFKRCSFTQWFHEDPECHLNRKRRELDRNNMRTAEQYFISPSGVNWAYDRGLPWEATNKEAQTVAVAAERLNILILGGTSFMGRDLVELLASSHNITLANRGLTNPDLFPDLRRIFYDRYNFETHVVLDNGIVYDVVVDFCSVGNEEQLRSVMRYVKFKRYIVISSTAAMENLDKDHDLYEYARNKRSCEGYLREEHPGNIVCVRPPIVYGEHDYTGRSAKHDDGEFYWAVDSGWFQKGERIAGSHVPAVHVRDCSLFINQFLSTKPGKSKYVTVPF